VNNAAQICIFVTMIRILHIETATKVCSVGLSENGMLKDKIEESSDRYIHAERLTVFIENIMSSNALSFKDLSAIAVTSGPGSYTGLRIGVSTAKGLCYALDVPLLSVNSLDGILAQGREAYPNQTICAMIDARRMEVFSKICDAKGDVLKPISADELLADSYASFQPFVVCGDGAEKCATLWQDSDVVIDDKISSSVSGQVTIAFEKFQKESFEDLAYFEPFYLKDFVATQSKKKLL
jgi:tRNA threonylcarbamoyladenosine biosynthesis protein TsaB